ncbi:hypothetical protein E4191_18300 (plasmid) [Paracoccus liaowanqingii]|uniref:Two pore domain potassium channel family protein n=1 Tax=Paracoccus liaowanqingii TaxID=2560053 RepID=A0A4Y5SRF8_9RHOB|nr:hypothetical protein [Paracoccus liaowanqingii]QDA36080.1 hypothetical protein E4191_18300 [Paracoccus liaowanqingii]
MTEPLMITVGIALVLVSFYDFLRTTISLSGLGFISRTLASGLWRAGSGFSAILEQRTGLSLRGVLGPAILIVLAGAWVLMHLAGYVLILRGGLSLEQTKTGDPATWLQTVAFAGSTLSTLGASTVRVTGEWWDVLSMIAAVNGMVLLTLSVSFLLNILQTTNSARTFAIRFRIISARGPDKDTAARIESLGPDLSSVVVMLSASSLPGVFVPHDPAMDFPSAIAKLCDLARDGTLSEGSELVAALAILGRHLGDASHGDDLSAARAWAEHYTLERA